MRLLLTPVRAEIVERGSRFVALAHPAASLEAALAVRDAERRRHHDATHHVYAARLARGAARFDDDGEPAGTGGRPVLTELEIRELVDAVVVVTRWFGGTRLGRGGLARAYGLSAAGALEKARTRPVIAGEIRYIVYDFDDIGAVARVLEADGVARGPDEYGQRVRTEVRVPRGHGSELDRRLRDATSGRTGLEPDENPGSCWFTITA